MVLLEQLDSDGSAASAAEDGGGAIVKKAAGHKGAGVESRTRSASRRRKIRKEVKAKAARARDTWALQQQLLGPGTAQGLMDAAQKMLDPENYRAVVEERSLEGVCGFPSCAKPALGVAGGKKWKVDCNSREVFPAEEVGRFCSINCLRNSGEFALRLDPDPAYCRPASAVAASRSATAEAAEAAKASARGPKAVACAASSPVGDDSAREEKAAVAAEGTGEAPAADGEAESGTAQKPDKKSLPPVRRSAVVRFSRVAQTYNVHYSDYDGGGALPGVPSTPAAAADGDAASKTATEPKEPATQADLERMLRAPILEKAAPNSAAGTQEVGNNDPVVAAQAEEPPMPNCSPEPALDTSAQCAVGGGIPQSSEEVADGDPGVTPDSSRQKDERKPHFAEAEECIEDEEQDGGESGEDDDETGVRIERGDDVLEGLFDWDATFPENWSGSAFVRAWGVLSSWLTQTAKDTLRGSRQPGVPGSCEEGRQAHRGRRSLLVELMTERVPGELTFLCPRLEVVVASFGVHQTLPSVAEFKLYDLLAALLLRAVFRAEVRRRAVDASDDHERVLQHRVNLAARALKVTDEELASLDAVFGS